MSRYQVISEETGSRGIVIFEGTLKECYEFQKNYHGDKYPSLSINK